MIDVNKFKIFYVVVIILILIMILTKGFSGNTIIYSYNDADKGIVDGFAGQISLSILNCFIIAIIMILTIILTFNKKNTINKKILLLILIILLSSCIPVGTHSYSGGIAGTINADNINLWNIPIYLVR